jgi:ketosteroid isomerase-like protein
MICARRRLTRRAPTGQSARTCAEAIAGLTRARVPGMAPGDLHEAVETAFNNRDVEALVALYEHDASLFGLAGPVQGTEAIRAAWTEMLAMAGETRLVTQYVIEQDDIALLSNRWTSVAGEDEISATSAEVARRQSDGTWKYVIDNPDSAGVLAG